MRSPPFDQPRTPGIAQREHLRKRLPLEEMREVRAIVGRRLDEVLVFGEPGVGVITEHRLDALEEPRPVEQIEAIRIGKFDPREVHRIE